MFHSRESDVFLERLSRESMLQDYYDWPAGRYSRDFFLILWLRTDPFFPFVVHTCL